MKGIAVLALGWASSGIAQAGLDTPNYHAMSDDELGENARAIVNDAFRDPCRNNLQLFEELSRRNPSHVGYRTGSLTARALCALQESRYEDGLRFVRQAESAQTVPILDKIGLDLAIKMTDGTEALARLRRIASDNRLGHLGRDFLFAGVQTIRSANLGDEFDYFAYQLVTSSGLAQLVAEEQTPFVVAALRHAAENGDLEVRRLLDHIHDPSEGRRNGVVVIQVQGP